MPKLTKDLILNQRYRLIRCLGEGGMATVWLATDMKLEVHVALKFLHKTSEGNLNYHRALKREWEIASHLIHPNIIRVYEFHEDSVSPFYSMQFIDGPAISILCKEDLKNILPVISLIADALDYAHGTGHGVGYFQNVHEGTHAISKNNSVNFKEGMVVSNEPGYYEKNNFGIRIENLIYVKKNKNNIYFDNLTMAPIDKDLIDKSILNRNEINWINHYHEKVFVNLKKFMNKVEIFELKQACSAI